MDRLDAREPGEAQIHQDDVRPHVPAPSLIAASPLSASPTTSILLLERMGQRAPDQLLVVDQHDSTCADNYMTNYFLTGALPAKGTVCSQNLPPFASAEQ